MRGQPKPFSLGLVSTVLGACVWVFSQATNPESAPPQSPPASNSQNGPHAPANPPRRTLEAQAELRRIALALNLTPEQREKLRPIVNHEGEQLSAVRLDERMTPEQKRAKGLEIRESFRPKIAEVLTPEQQEKWKKMEEASQPQPRATSSDTGKAPAKPQ